MEELLLVFDGKDLVYNFSMKGLTLGYFLRQVFVMTPEIFLRILQHCFLRMDLISLLIFDECHHAQAQKRHPYAQIMKVLTSLCRKHL